MMQKALWGTFFILHHKNASQIETHFWPLQYRIMANGSNFLHFSTENIKLILKSGEKVCTKR